MPWCQRWLTSLSQHSWNALYGIPTKAIKAGDVVLIQGTGGVSIFALQLAKAAGCTVIATTSTDEKAQVLRSLGADHIINYKRNSDWGVKAKEIVPQGVDHVLEVGGPKTMAQSLQAIRPDGVITIIGFGMSYIRSFRLRWADTTLDQRYSSNCATLI